ncbi:hypothetical protein IQ250_22230 [Pseudanabaenaceae cyanobacterium LEGE 13415]|nr:hypothetical protein [Pseudanabaenaceae cyanobacterium LEGE 13415]
MTELKLISQHPNLRSLIESAIAESLCSVEAGIQRTQARLQAFETQYQLSTDEFLERYENDEIQETLEIDEWIGESRLLKRLQEKAIRLKEVRFAD